MTYLYSFTNNELDQTRNQVFQTTKTNEVRTKMGLLSDPEYGSVRWVKVLKKVHGLLCMLCYIGAIVWFVMLGNREFNNETYFSENALLPGLVTNEFNGEHAAKQFHNEFLKELEDKYDNSEKMPVPWLVAKMSQLHLEVYTHNFTLNFPLGVGQVYKGTNVYGILRAPRTSSLEAIVISAPFRALSSYQKGTTAGIALMLAFAQFARPQKYWAKDIIFLITEHEQLGMQAWLEAYHGLQSDAETFYTSLGSFWKPGTPSLDFGKLAPGFSWGDHQKCLNPGKLKGRSGSIQAAINLEFHTPKIKYIEVKVEGLNGQLPNLDLVNLVHKLCIKSGIHHSYKNSYSWMRSRNKMEDWTNSLRTMMGMLTAQFAGVPNGNHGLFHRFNIEAVTLEGREANDPDGIPPRVNALSTANFYRLGLALESTLRSLNNLLERFHQSYFFYVLAATNRFISIGLYMPSLCLLCVAMLIRALYLWVTIQQDDDDEPLQTDKKSKKKLEKDKKSKAEKDKQSDDEDSKKSNEQSEKDKKPDDEDSVEIKRDKKSDSEQTGEQTVRQRRKSAEKLEKLKSSDSEVPEDNKPKEKRKKRMAKREESSMSIVNIGANYLLVHLLGYAVMNLPMFFSRMGAKYNQPSEVSVFYGLFATSTLLTTATPLFLRLRAAPITREELSLVNILVLVELATMCLSVGVHNFSLGLILAVVYTPLALMAGVTVKGKGRNVGLYFKRAFCLLLHPLCVLIVSMIIYCSFLFPQDSLFEKATRGRDAAMQAIMFSVVDSMIYGNWLFNVATSLLFPIWMIFWQIVSNPIKG